MNLSEMQTKLDAFSEHLRIEIERFEFSTGTRVNRIGLVRHREESAPYYENLVKITMDVDVIDLR